MKQSLTSALVTYAAVAGQIRALAVPGRLKDDEFQVVAVGVLAMALGEALKSGRSAD